MCSIDLRTLHRVFLPAMLHITPTLKQIATIRSPLKQLREIRSKLSYIDSICRI